MKFAQKHFDSTKFPDYPNLIRPKSSYIIYSHIINKHNQYNIKKSFKLNPRDYETIFSVRQNYPKISIASISMNLPNMHRF